MSSSTDLTVGRIGRAHGIRGEVSVRVLVDELHHFDRGSRLHAGEREFVVAHSRHHKNTLLVAFENVLTRNDAEALRGVELVVPGAVQRDLEPGEYWPDDLIGLQVEDHSGVVGLVVDVVQGKAQDRLVIRGSNKTEFEIPFVDELVPEIRIGEGIIRIAPTDGLI